jgi:hypothetical protein
MLTPSVFGEMGRIREPRHCATRPEVVGSGDRHGAETHSDMPSALGS